MIHNTNVQINLRLLAYKALPLYLIFKDQKTWGEAILERIRQQNSEEFKRGYGSFDRPDVVVSNANYNALIDMLLNVARIGTSIYITVQL
jgi:hypothetical protein